MKPLEEMGKFATVVVDPPWEMVKIERDVRPNQHGFDYPTMTYDEIAACNLPLSNDALVFCWTTQKHLPATFDILNAWGLKYRFTMVWHKPGGFQPVGLPQHNAEFVVVGACGNPKFLDTRAFNMANNWPRGVHSEKPEGFYDLLRRVTPGHALTCSAGGASQAFSRGATKLPKAGHSPTITSRCYWTAKMVGVPSAIIKWLRQLMPRRRRTLTTQDTVVPEATAEEAAPVDEAPPVEVDPIVEVIEPFTVRIDRVRRGFDTADSALRASGTSIETAVETVSALEERLEEAKSQLASAVSDRDTLVANAVAASAAERNVLREYESGLA